MSDAASAAARVDALRAFEVVLRDPHALLDVVLTAGDFDEAQARIVARYGVSVAAAAAVMDMQFRRLTGTGRQRLAEELAARLAE